MIFCGPPHLESKFGVHAAHTHLIHLLEPFRGEFYINFCYIRATIVTLTHDNNMNFQCWSLEMCFGSVTEWREKLKLMSCFLDIFSLIFVLIIFMVHKSFF